MLRLALASGIPAFSSEFQLEIAALKIATSTLVVNKASGDQFKQLNGSFTNTDISLVQLAEHIDRGFCFCPQHKGGWRKQSNFSAAGFLAVDIDNGLQVEEALELPFVQAFGGLLYTTPSHKSDHHRFRIIFELERPIEDATQMRYALTGLILRFGGDESCKDPCRLFYGSKGSNPTVFGKTLPAAEIAELIQRGQESGARVDTLGHKGRSAIRSRVVVAADTMVETPEGHRVRLADLPPKTTIHCPKHEDRRASAFTLRSKSGTPGLYCSACRATFFLKDEPPLYYFNYNLQQFLTITPDEYEAYADENGNVSLSEVRGGLVRILDHRYLPFDEDIYIRPTYKAFDDAVEYIDRPWELDPLAGFVANRNISFIRSPKGTGKTKWLERLAGDFRAHGVSTLLIGHRQSLISASAQRLNLRCYFSTRKAANGVVTEYCPPASHYAICVDSLPTLLNPALHKYEVVIIDEVEQVFAHLLSETLRERRREALHTLAHYLRTAKAVYVLDADLNRVTVNVLADLLSDNRERAWQFIANTWKTPGGKVHLYESKDHLTQELVAAIERGERCFVAANSKGFVQKLHRYLVERFRGSRRFLEIDADNGQSPESQEFIENIKERILDYDCVLASPALGTGIDISFPGNAQKIDAVFGFFEARVNTHFDIDQQLSRVRNPKRLCVWITPEEYRFETSLDAIMDELRQVDRSYRYLTGISEEGVKVYSEDPLYESVYANVTALQRGSKNRLRNNFCDLRRHNGWEIIVVSNDTALSGEGRKVLRESRVLAWDDWVCRVMGAEVLPTSRYDELRRQSETRSLSEAEQSAMRRYEIESFYYRDVSEALLELDDNGRFRDSVRMFEYLRTSDAELRDRDSSSRKLLPSDRSNLLVKKQLLVRLLTTAGVLRGDGAFDAEVTVSAADLDEFIKRCCATKNRVELLFDTPIRSDIGRKPTQQLGALLQLVGLKLERAEIRKVGGRKTYRYKVSPVSLHLMASIVERRADSAVKTAWKESRLKVDPGEDELSKLLRQLREKKSKKEQEVDRVD